MISHKIMSPFKECKQDNVTYMCILNWILPGGWWRSMIKCSKVCPLALKLIKQKVGASGNWFWLTLKVFEVLVFYEMVILEISHYGCHQYHTFG